MTRWTEADIQAVQRARHSSVSEARAASSYGPKAKFRNIPTSVDGVKFDSRAEARRYGELKTLEQAGHVTNLELQPKFHLDVAGQHICDYTGDFRYWDVQVAPPLLVVEDVKSKATRTPQYRIKVKLMKAIHGIDVKEIA